MKRMAVPVVLLVVVAVAAAQEAKPDQLVKTAVEAAGGTEALNKLPAGPGHSHFTLRSNLMIGGEAFVVVDDPTETGAVRTLFDFSAGNVARPLIRRSAASAVDSAESITRMPAGTASSISGRSRG